MMDVPSYFLRQPTANWRADTIASFEELYQAQVEHGIGAEISYTLQAPKWQFLVYLSDHKNILLHGSGEANIQEFEPRQSSDVTEFGNRRAVYAASDGLWAMYFAIVDRDNYVTSLVNACARFVEGDTKSEPYYYFSINDDALPHHPWRNGTIYILPRDTFEAQPPMHWRGVVIEPAQWASLVSVKPLAKLQVSPEDFPFLDEIHGHNFQVLSARAAANPDGFPWRDDS